MWAKCTLLLLIVCSTAVLLISCNEDKKNIPSLNSNFQDSTSFWLSRDNAENKQFYIQNLQKALSSIQTIESDSLKAVYTSKLSYQFFKVKDSLNFKRANALAFLYGQKNKDSSKMAAAHWDNGDFLRFYNVIDSAYYHYNEAHKIYKTLNNDYNAGRMLYNMSVALSIIKDYTSAETHAIEALALFKPLEKYGRLNTCYNHLGIIANNLNEYQKALEYHALALKFLDKQDNNGTALTTSINNIGAVYLAQEDYKLALNQFLEVIKTDSLFIKRPSLYAKALSNLAYCRVKLGDTANVRNNLRRSMDIQDSINDITALSRSYYIMSDFLLTIKDSMAALNYANKAKKTSQNSDNNLRVLKTLGLLTKIDPKNATRYSQEYITLNDSLQIAERRARNKFERIRFETNETLAENALLARQKQLWTGIAATLLLLAVSTFIIVQQRRKNEKLRFEEEQQASNQKIFNMLLSEKSKIEEGKKLAQKRISEELHDAVQSRIQGIRMLLLGLNKRNTPEAIEQRGYAITELQDVQEEVRTISHELSNSAYQKIYGFIITVQELLGEIHKNTGLESSFHFDEEIDWDGLSGDIKINVYRIIQECIQNCVKHARAKHVTLTFDLDKEAIFTITIIDNGKGFKQQGRKKGIGMRNINSRVEKLQGTWDIKSTLGEGTTVILYIPIKNQKEFSVTEKNAIAASEAYE